MNKQKFCNGDGNPDVDAEMLMLRFPNGPLILIDFLLLLNK